MFKGREGNCEGKGIAKVAIDIDLDLYIVETLSNLVF